MAVKLTLGEPYKNAQHEETTMNLTRRKYLQFSLAAAVTGLAWSAGPAHAQAYPAKPIRLIVPYSPGTPPDVVSRIVANKMTAELGQPIVIENRPGASGTVGLIEVAKQPADGYTLYTLLTPGTVAPSLYPHLSIDLKKQFEPVGQFTSYSNILVVPPGFPAKSVKELVALLKAKPGQYNFASGGNGTPAHLATELFKLQSGVSATHVPYNQFMQGIADLVAGRVDFMFLTSSISIPQIQSGKLRALAVTGPKRLASLPDVPTMMEEGFRDFDVRGWDGFIVKAGTPNDVISRLNAELAKATASPEVHERFVALGVEPVTESAEQFRQLINSEIDRWSQLVKSANIKAE